MTKRQYFFVLLLFLPSIVSTQIDHWETIVYNTDTWSYFIGNTEPPNNTRFGNKEKEDLAMQMGMILRLFPKLMLCIFATPLTLLI